MHRKGDTVHFDETDRRRFSPVPDYMPANQVPALFRLAYECRVDVVTEIHQLHGMDIHDMRHAEHQAALSDTTVRHNNLVLFMRDLGEVAAPEMVDDFFGDVLEGHPA